jgi:hypothetical protein
MAIFYAGPTAFTGKFSLPISQTSVFCGDCGPLHERLDHMRPLSYHNTPLSRKEHAVVLSSANMGKIIVKICYKPLFSIHQFQVIF